MNPHQFKNKICLASDVKETQTRENINFAERSVNLHVRKNLNLEHNSNLKHTRKHRKATAGKQLQVCEIRALKCTEHNAKLHNRLCNVTVTELYVTGAVW